MRLIDADVLAEIFSDRMEKIAERYGVYSSESGILSGAYTLLQSQPTIEPDRKSVLIIKSKVLMKKEQLEAYRKMFMEQKNDGVVLLPNAFDAQYVPNDVDVRINAADWMI